MTVTLDLKPEVEQALLAEAHERGISLDAYLEEIVSNQVRAKTHNTAIPELPRLHLGITGPLHRTDIYEDAR